MIHAKDSRELLDLRKDFFESLRFQPKPPKAVRLVLKTPMLEQKALQLLSETSVSQL